MSNCAWCGAENDGSGSHGICASCAAELLRQQEERHKEQEKAGKK